MKQRGGEFVDFIKQLVCFHRKGAGKLTPNAIAIYHYLFMVDNENGWEEWFEVSDYWMCQAVGIKRRETIVSALNLLKQKGFIEFERGGTHKPTRYHIIPLFNSAISSAFDSANNSAFSSANNSAISSAFDSAKNGFPLSNNKTKTKNKNIYTHEFDTFWSAYPNKANKFAAQKSFSKINPSSELLQTMLSSIEKFKQTSKWQKDNGEYIPNASTWLNNRRWEDEFVNEQQQLPLMTEEDEARRKEENERRFQAALQAQREKWDARYGGNHDNGTSEQSTG